MEEIRLVPALGKFHTLSANLMPFSESDSNLVIDYDLSKPITAKIAELLGPSRLPQKDTSNGRVIYARPEGGRSAVVASKYFDRQVSIPEKKVTGLKIKGCRNLDGPPLPISFVTTKPEIKGWEYTPEICTAYRKNGTSFRSFKDQPFGMTINHAEHDTVMSLAANYLKIPTNLFGIGTGEYEGMFFNGYYGKRKEPMGTAQFLLTRNDDRVSQLILDHQDSNISYADALKILSNLRNLAEELDTDIPNLICENLFKGSGKLLNRMHSAGFIHGPRQSHYMNYVTPTKEYPELAVCDFESSMLVSELSNEQAIRYMADDLVSVISSANNFYEVFMAALLKSSKEKLGMNDSAIAKAVKDVKKKQPASGNVMSGYVGGILIKKDTKRPEISFLDAVRIIRKDDLEETREKLDILRDAIYH